MEIDVRPQILEGKLIIPPKVLKRLEDMKTLYAGYNEYAMFLHAEVDMDNLEVFIDEDEYSIPYQTVSGAHVTIEDTTFEIDPETGYGKKPLDRTLNTAVHRHPDGCSAFSSEDQEYINSVNGISFLYQQGYVVPDAVINVPWGDKILPLKLTAYADVDGELIPISRRLHKVVYNPSIYTGSSYATGTYVNGKWIAKYIWDQKTYRMVANPDYEMAMKAKEAEVKKAEEEKPTEKTDYDKLHEACDNIETDLDVNVLKERIKINGCAIGAWGEEDVFGDAQGFLSRHQRKHNRKNKKLRIRDRGFAGFGSSLGNSVGGVRKGKPFQVIPRDNVVEFPGSITADEFDEEVARQEAIEREIFGDVDEEPLDSLDFMRK